MGHSGVNLEPDDTTNFTFSAFPKGTAGALGTVTAYTGAIPRIRTAEINSSFSTIFFGPVVECSTKQAKTNHVYCSGDAEMSYVSFLSHPRDSGAGFHDYFDLNASLPVESSGNISYIVCNSMASFRTVTFGIYPPGLFVVARTSIPDGAPDTDVPRQEWMATSCLLRNATYEVDVQTSGNDQIIAVKTKESSSLGLATDYVADFESSPDLLGPSANRIYNYFAMMAVVGQTVVGTVNSATDATSELYTAGGVVDITPAPFPGIFSTKLSSSPEIQAFAKWAGSPRVSDSPFASVSKGAPLARQLEELFRNMTVAMLTSPATSSNATVEVLHWEPVNIYKYTAWHLWLAYAVGLFATAVILSLGFVAISVNGAPYSNRFSTYLRTTPWSKMEDLLRDDGGTGADPLPRGTARTMLVLGDGPASSEIEMMEGEQPSGEHLVKRSGSIDRYAVRSQRASVEELVPSSSV